MYRFICMLLFCFLLCGCSQNNFSYRERSLNTLASKQAGLFVKEYELAGKAPHIFSVQEAWIERVAIKDKHDKTLNEPGYRFCLNLNNEAKGISLFDKATGEAVGVQTLQQHSFYTYAGSTINNCIFVDSLELTAYKEGSEDPPRHTLFRSKP